MADSKKKTKTKEVSKKTPKYSYGIDSKKELPPSGTPKHKMMVLSGEIKE